MRMRARRCRRGGQSSLHVIFDEELKKIHLKISDIIFVSIDGLQKTHDAIRGKSFDGIIENIKANKKIALFYLFLQNIFRTDRTRTISAP